MGADRCSVSENREVEVFMELRSFMRPAATLLALFALTACGNREIGTDPGQAALIVVVNTPIARAGAVAIHGPTAHASYVAATDTLRGLIPGQYDAHADNVAASDSLVSPVLTGVVSGSPVMVEVGHMDSVIATYAIRGGSGALWVGKWGSTNLAEGFTSAQLASAGTVAAADTVGAATLALTISGTAFDSAGNLWVTDYINQQILKFTPAQLASGVSTPAVAILTSKEPWGIAFDAAGNLWVGYYNGNYVLEYAASDVQSWSGASTDPTPALSVATPNGPLGLAFDHGGNLWVAGFDVPLTYEVASSAIAAGTSGGTITPTDSLSSSFLNHGSGLAFDRAGNLWEGTEDGYLLGYTASQLGAASHGDPSFAQLAPSYSFDEVAIDNSGNLWAATETPDVAMYSPAQQTSGDLSVAARTLTASTGERTFGLAFNTHDTALPISPAFASLGASAVRRAAAPQAHIRDGSRPGMLRRR
jgi:ligand-binding sensor domain-containing protein